MTIICLTVSYCDHHMFLGIVLEYSIDFGHTWNTLQKECMPSDVTCSGYHGSSSFRSDVYGDWNRVTMVLPHYTR